MTTAFTYDKIPDWPKLRNRYLAFWNRQVIDDSPIVQIQNPKPHPVAPQPWMLEATPEKYLNPEKYYEYVTWLTKGHWNWHADLFQYTFANYGAGLFTLFCGAKPHFGEDSVWFDPIISSLDEAEKIHFDPDTNPYWKIHRETLAYLAEKCRGVEILSLSNAGGGPCDWISTCMGTENFIMATVDQPDKMRDLAIRLTEEYLQIFPEVFALVGRYNDGMANWFPIWNDGPLVDTSDDMSIIIDPRRYAEVFLPAQRLLCRQTQRPVLHWHDGAAFHLDALLTLENLDFIQLGHDPNSGPFTGQCAMMQKIQRAGKKLFISCVEANEVEYFINHLDPRGLAMIINTESDEASKRMQDDVVRWTRQRMKNY